MSTARVTTLILEVLAPDTSDGTTTAVASGSGRATAVSAATARTSTARASGSGRSIARGGAASGGSVSYAEIIDGRVTGIYTGSLPASSDTVLYIDLTGYSTPSVGDYFSEICQTFSSTEPTVDPGDIVPPWTKPRDGTNGKDGTNGLDGGVGPFPPASTLPVIIPFQAYFGTSITATASVAETEINARLRTAFDLADVCGIRVQAQVRTSALPGVEVVLKYSTDNGSTWDYVSDAVGAESDGPFVELYRVGDVRGDMRNVRAGAQDDVLLSLFIRNGDGSSTVTLGNVAAFAYVKTDANGVCTTIDAPSGTCLVLPAVTLNGGAISDDFSAYDTMADVVAAGWSNAPGLRPYVCVDADGPVHTGVITRGIGSGTTLVKTHVASGTPVGDPSTTPPGRVLLTEHDAIFSASCDLQAWLRIVEYYLPGAPVTNLSIAFGAVRLQDAGWHTTAIGSPDGAGLYWHNASVDYGVSRTNTAWITGAAIDMAAYVAAGVHDLVFQFTYDPIAHEVSVEVFDNGVSQGTHNYGVNPSAFGDHMDWGFDRVQPAFYGQTASGLANKHLCLAAEAGYGTY